MSHEEKEEKDDEVVVTASSSDCKEDVMVEEQRYMFGTDCIVKMFDGILDQMEHVMKEGITTLPYLPTTQAGGKEALLQIMLTSYRTNMDLAELYAIRNIFTIPSHYTKYQRQQILQHYSNQLNTNPTTDISNTNVKEVIPQQQQEEQQEELLRMRMISKKKNVLADVPKCVNDIPSPNDLNVLDQETLELQSKLQNSKEHQRKCQMKLQTIQQASKKAMTTFTKLQQIVKMTNTTNTTTTSGFEQVQESINTAIVGQEALKDLCTKGTQLNQQMNDIQAQRTSSKEENDTIHLETVMKHMAHEVEKVQKRKNNSIPSLDDDIEERKKRIKINIPTTTKDETNNNDATTSSSFTSILKLR